MIKEFLVADVQLSAFFPSTSLLLRTWHTSSVSVFRNPMVFKLVNDLQDDGVKLTSLPHQDRVKFRQFENHPSVDVSLTPLSRVAVPDSLKILTLDFGNYEPHTGDKDDKASHTPGLLNLPVHANSARSHKDLRHQPLSGPEPHSPFLGSTSQAQPTPPYATFDIAKETSSWAPTKSPPHRTPYSLPSSTQPQCLPSTAPSIVQPSPTVPFRTGFELGRPSTIVTQSDLTRPSTAGSLATASPGANQTSALSIRSASPDRDNEPGVIAQSPSPPIHHYLAPPALLPPVNEQGSHKGYSPQLDYSTMPYIQPEYCSEAYDLFTEGPQSFLCMILIPTVGAHL